MAVYEQSYHRWEGALTPLRTRFLVIPRYAYQRLSGSKLLWALLVVSTLTALGTAVLIYVRNNARLIEALGIQLGDTFAIGPGFFAIFLGTQLGIGFLLVLIAGPALISMDLANGALPLYLARPITRREYVLGKLTVLAAMLSVTTWVYGLALWGLQASLAGGEWALDNLRIASGLFLGSWVWILVLSFLTLALSALIRWPLAVRGVLLVLFLVLPAFGFALSQILRTPWGQVIDLGSDLSVVVGWLLGVPETNGPPVLGACLVLATVVALSILVIAARLRAQEVVT